MIIEYGTVIELKSSQVATVLCQKKSACQHCPSSDSCQTGDDGQSMQVDAFNAVGAQMGQRVKVVTSAKNLLQSSFILYIVPIIGLLIGAGAGQFLGENVDLGLDPMLLSALLGVAFMVGTFLCIRVGTQALKKEVFMPRIVEIESDAISSDKELSNHGN